MASFITHTGQNHCHGITLGYGFHIEYIYPPDGDTEKFCKKVEALLKPRKIFEPYDTKISFYRYYLLA